MKFSIEKISRDLLPKDFQIPQVTDIPNDEPKTWALWLQFDNSTPAKAVDNIKLGERLSISWIGPGEQSEIVFTDPITKKTFKLFGKLNT